MDKIFLAIEELFKTSRRRPLFTCDCLQNEDFHFEQVFIADLQNLTNLEPRTESRGMKDCRVFK